MALTKFRVEVKLTQSNDIGALVNAISQVDINGRGNFVTSIKVAQLSLKHRMNKQQRQRVIAFVGHPIGETLEQCEDLGKRLKRNNVAIDLINFANPDNVPKLEALVCAANNQSNSHFMDVPAGISMITDVLFTSPILGNEEASSMGGQVPGSSGTDADASAGGAGRFAEYGGIDPNLEPELAMAMKFSLEEDRA